MCVEWATANEKSTPEQFYRKHLPGAPFLPRSSSRPKTIEGQIARRREHVEAVMAALVTVPGSKHGAKLATEEAKLS